MKSIIAPLKLQDKNDQVANLQAALFFLLEKQIFKPESDQLKQFLSEGLKKERGQQLYGDVTARAVILFQEQYSQQFHLAQNGTVDAPTASALNQLLEQAGAFQISEPTPTNGAVHVVGGRMTRADEHPLSGSIVRAVHVAGRTMVRLGEDRTDVDGHYTIRYDAMPGTTLTLQVLVLDEIGTTIASGPPIIAPQAVQVVDLIVPLIEPPATTYRVDGRILFDHGLPAVGLKLRLYRIGLGGVKEATQLDEATSREEGLYSFSYSPGHTAVNLEVRAVDANNTETSLSEPVWGAAEREVLNLVAPSSLQPLKPEYERLTSDLLPHIASLDRLAQVEEHGDRSDLTVLHQVTKWDARVIAMAATATKLSAADETGLGSDVLYGLLRVGLPSDKHELAHVSSEALGHALNKVHEAGILHLDDNKKAQVMEAFNTFSLKTRLAAQAPGSIATYGDFLKTLNMDEAAQTTFAKVFTEHRGDPASLWPKVGEAGLGPMVPLLQRQGKLAFLTTNNPGLTAKVQADLGNGDLKDLVAKQYYKKEKWLEVIDADQVPPVFGSGSQAKKPYADELARKVRISYSTEVAWDMIKTGELTIEGQGSAATVGLFLQNAIAKGFKLGESKIADFVKANPDVWTGIPADAQTTTRSAVESLQRVYQITPSNEAMKALLDAGFISAQDVLAYPLDVFIERFSSATFPPEQARLVYRKAELVGNVTMSLSVLGQELVRAPALPVMSGSEQERTDLLKKFPTLESLFGSLDYCECEHCRSVLSPAAYLVDLLQFINPEPKVWDSFVKQWQMQHSAPYPFKQQTEYDTFLANWRAAHPGEPDPKITKTPFEVLAERRPDIQHIPLTCENTHTVLPHIDLVNEILEYFVVHRALGADATKDTGTATTPELLAEPQYIEPKAYEILKAAKYPLTLPFDLWIETVRQFCDYLDTPLWKVMETFRRTDQLFAPTEPYDRAAVFLESLGLSPVESALFTDPDPLKTWFTLYGFDTEGDALTVKTETTTGQRVDLNSAKALSRRLGVTYKELADVLRTRFVNPDLNQLVALNKLRLDIKAVRLVREHQTDYEQNKDLLGKDVKTLSSADQVRYDKLQHNKTSTDQSFNWEDLEEIGAVMVRLDKFAQEFPSFEKNDWLRNTLPAIPLDRIVVLVDPDTGCNFDRTTVQYVSGKKVDAEALLRINLFVRLWRKLGWTIEETDQALVTFIPKGAPYTVGHFNTSPFKTALIYMAHLKALETRLDLGKQERLKLLTIWSDLSTTGKENLYTQLFLSRSQLKSDPIFDDPLGLYLTDGSIKAQKDRRTITAVQSHVLPSEKLTPSDFAGQVGVANVDYDEVAQTQYLTYAGILSDTAKAHLLTLSSAAVLRPLLEDIQTQAREYGLIKGHVLAIQGALGLTAEEIARILDDQDGLESTTARLSIENLSILYRYAIFAKALKITVAELISLKQLSSINPFDRLKDGSLTTLEEDGPFSKTLAFVELANLIKASGVNIADLEYLLRHRFDPSDRYGPEEQKQLAFVANLLNSVRSIHADYGLPSDPEALTDDWLKAKLGLLLRGDVLDRIFGFMNGSFEVTVSKKNVPEGDQLAPILFTNESTIKTLTYDKQAATQSITFRGVLLETQRDALKATYSTKLTSGQHLVLGTLLDQIHERQRTLFETEVVSAGFLKKEDFSTVYSPAKSVRDKRIELTKAILPVIRERLIRQLLIQTVTSTTGAEEKLVSSLVTDPVLFGETGQPTKSLLDLFSEVAGAKVGHESGKERCVRTFMRLSKGLQLIQILGLTEREVRYILTHASEFSAISLRFFPWYDAQAALDEAARKLRTANPALSKTDAVAQARIDHPDIAGEAAQSRTTFHQVVRLIHYVGLKQEVVGGSDGLIAVFELNAEIDKQQTDQDKVAALEKVYGLLTTLTRRTGDLVGQTARVLFKNPRFADEQSVQRLWEGLQVVERFGVPVSALRNWTRIAKPITATADPSLVPSSIAGDLKATLKTRFDQETWQRVVQPIFDKLRRRQRDALSAHVMHLLRFDRMEQLFEYFLLDPGIEPAVQTSRIRAAISAVQIFIHRCFLNLELWVQPSSLNSKHWPWMKQYRVWEANRKIFLFPENLLEPEFLDDKTHLFREEVEGPLLQGIVSPDLAEDVFVGYLRRFDKLARVEILGMYCEEHPLDPATNTLHVIGRTYSSPREYFYRRYVHQIWTPWEPVTAEVQGDHVVPIVWRNRLHLFWVTFVDQPDPSAGPKEVSPLSTEKVDRRALVLGGSGRFNERIASSVSGAQGSHQKSSTSATLAGMSLGELSTNLRTAMPNKLVQIQLHWSEYFQGEWSTRESADFKASMTAIVSFAGFDEKQVPIYATKEMDGREERAVRINLGGEINKAFRVVSRNSVPTWHRGTAALPSRPYTTSIMQATQLIGNGTLQVTFVQRIETENRSSPKVTTASPNILQTGVGFALVPCGSYLTTVAPDVAALVAPLFYQDGLHTFFVEPRFKEKTIEEWEEWLRKRTEPPTEWDQPKWWKELPLSPIVPYYEMPKLVDPRDRVWKTPLDPRARFGLDAKQDWIVNEATVMQFKDSLVGQTGRTSLSIQHNIGSGVTVGLTTPVMVNSGSGLPADLGVVAPSDPALNHTAATPSANGLNVVGAGGFNQALAKNISAGR